MSVNSVIEELARELGFSDVYFINTSFAEDCVAMLMYAYAPYDGNEYVSAYYIASNKSYHAMKELIQRLNQNGIAASSADLPLKQAAQDAHIGLMGKNTLLHTRSHGSRIVLHAFHASGAAPEEYNLTPHDICANCQKCIEVCPTGAISNTGFTASKCMRRYMESPPYPEFVSSNIRTYLGCELCMNVCPYNAHIKKTVVPEEIRDALLPERIISKDVKAAKYYLGSNIKTSRLVADAEAMLMRSRTERDN